MNRLVLIDGNAIMHRAYHALPSLTTRDGQPINAVYGFTSMLLRIIQDLKPSAIIVTFDRPEPTFRKKLFSDYQSHRPEMEHTLSSQFTLVKEVVSAMKIPILEKAGYEADDIIGTLARKMQHAACSMQHGKEKIDEMIIVTGDRDILQLVNDHVKVYMPVKGLSEAKMYGSEEVIEKFEVPPKQIPDYKGLIGDPSDNYPGVSGIGPKTAVSLLTQFKTIEDLYTSLDKKVHVHNFVSERVAAQLQTHKDDALLSKKLATIVTDVPIDINLSKLSAPVMDSDEVMKVFERLGFHSLMKRLMVEEDTRLLRQPTDTARQSPPPPQVAARHGKKDTKDDSQLSLL